MANVINCHTCCRQFFESVQGGGGAHKWQVSPIYVYVTVFDLPMTYKENVSIRKIFQKILTN